MLLQTSFPRCTWISQLRAKWSSIPQANHLATTLCLVVRSLFPGIRAVVQTTFYPGHKYSYWSPLSCIHICTHRIPLIGILRRRKELFRWQGSLEAHIGQGRTLAKLLSMCHRVGIFVFFLPLPQILAYKYTLLDNGKSYSQWFSSHFQYHQGGRIVWGDRSSQVHTYHRDSYYVHVV